MKLRSILGRAVLGAIVATYIGLHLQKIFDQRPFKFEHYRSSKALEAALKIHFPLGSNAEKAMNQLVQSGAECKVYDDRHKNDEPIPYLVSCKYHTGFISLIPMEHYKIYLDAEKDLCIYDYFASQSSGFWA
jgi:hypothetical protein